MLKPMTPAQKQLAEEHMDLVPKIIRSLIQGFPLTSEQRRELCQIGYLALCRAAVSCGEGFPFAPYAAAAIRNAIFDFWRHEIREKIFSARCRKICWMLRRPCRLASNWKPARMQRPWH